MLCFICLEFKYQFSHLICRNLYCVKCRNYLCGHCIYDCKLSLLYVSSVSHYFCNSFFEHKLSQWVCSEKCGIEYSIKRNIDVKPIKNIQRKIWANIIINKSLNDILIDDLIKIIQSY